MKKIIALLLILASLAAFVSCDDGDGVPNGMQLVFGGESAGYCFYSPEGWLISNLGDIKSAYISRVNTTSVSFTEVKLDSIDNKEDYFFNSYFNDYADEFEVFESYELLDSGSDCTFGTGESAADRAKKYIYTVEYSGFEFCFMLILAKRADRYFMFVYSAQNEAEEGVTPNYEKYLSEAMKVVENFRFLGNGSETEENREFTKDADGYNLISDRKLAGFDFYVPDEFKFDFASAIVSATHTDGSNVNMTEATATGISAKEYWTKRKNDLSKIFKNVTEIEIDKETSLGNNGSSLYGDWAYSYEYTYEHGENKYHVYQILAIDGTKGYVFTYTALEENYAKHFDKVLKIIEKVHF